MPPVVEAGMASWCAIAAPLMRCRRKRSFSATRAAGTLWRPRCGAELRSSQTAGRPTPARHATSATLSRVTEAK
jgi:hypothetical protein